MTAGGFFGKKEDMRNILQLLIVFFLFIFLYRPLGAEEGNLDTWPAFTGPLFLQSQKPLRRIQPESSILGAIGDENSNFLPCKDFWQSFQKGILLEDSLSEQVHPIFMEELKENLKLGSEITDFYFGEFQSRGSRGALPLALFSSRGAIHGVLYLVKKLGEGKLWKIEDGDIPFKDWPGETLKKGEKNDTPPEGGVF